MAKRSSPPPLTKVRKNILIVDDHPTTREGLCAVINREPDLRVCGDAANSGEVTHFIEKLGPDLVLLDISMPGKGGLELIKDLKALHPQLAILVFSVHEEALYAERMLRAGASGYITKQQPHEELLKAIRRVLDHNVYLSPKASENLLQRFSGKPHANQSPLALLTDREFEVFQLIGQGKTPKDMAKQLHLSAKTVAVHNANIRQKLKLKSTAQLIRFAVQSEE